MNPVSYYRGGEYGGGVCVCLTTPLLHVFCIEQKTVYKYPPPNNPENNIWHFT